MGRPSPPVDRCDGCPGCSSMDELKREVAGLRDADKKQRNQLSEILAELERMREELRRATTPKTMGTPFFKREDA